MRGLAVGAVGLIQTGGALSAAGVFPYEDTAAVASGKLLYGEYCASCHGTDLKGEANWRSPGEGGMMPAPPHDGDGHTWHHPDTLLFLITKFGTAAMVGGDYKSNMIGFEGVLSDDEILETLAYIKSTWPARVIEMHNTVNENSAASN